MPKKLLAVPKNNNRNNNIIFIVKITSLPNTFRVTRRIRFKTGIADRWRRLNGTAIVYYYHYYYYYLSSLKLLLALLLTRVLTLKSRARVSSPIRTITRDDHSSRSDDGLMD